MQTTGQAVRCAAARFGRILDDPTLPLAPWRHRGAVTGRELRPATVGRYRIVRRLGRGGMGEVVLGEDLALGRRVAIKRLCLGADAPAPDARMRLRREARLAARLDHRAIVRVHDLVTDGDADHIVMELVEGPSLREVHDRGPLPVAEVLRVVREVLEGLAHAHERGVVHCDLKLENVLLDGDGQPKIADFGIAILDGEDPRSAAEVVGTPRTMSPEQIRGERVDVRSDLFSLGVMLYELLAGVSPFAAESDRVTLLRVVHDEPRPIGELVAGLPREVCDLVAHLLEKSPARRPATARDVLARYPLPSSIAGARASCHVAGPR